MQLALNFVSHTAAPIPERKHGFKSQSTSKFRWVMAWGEARNQLFKEETFKNPFYRENISFGRHLEVAASTEWDGLLIDGVIAGSKVSILVCVSAHWLDLTTSTQISTFWESSQPADSIF